MGFMYGYKKPDTLYSLLCIDITIEEQIRLFGTCGRKNILKKYTTEEVITRITQYLNEKKEKNHE